ncbi:hypothetical protein V8C34DRAFT_318057 [Trichoderma compactum]
MSAGDSRQKGRNKSRDHSNEPVVEGDKSGTVKSGSLVEHEGENGKPSDADPDPWIEAYEKLRNDEKERKLVNEYEKILTNRATAKRTGTQYVEDDVQADAPNQFEGLTGAGRVDMMKATLNPTEGLEFVMNRMDWYILLTKVVLQRDSLRDEVVTLFKSLLKFEMECACRAYRTHPVVSFLGDIVSLSGWEEKLGDIKKHGEIIEKDLQSYGINTLAEYSLQTASNTKDILAEVKKFNERRDDLVELISRFGATMYRDQMEFNPKRHPGTCEWFCRHPKYKSWLNSTKKELHLVTAEPGCGKSVLARFLIETELPSQGEDAVIGYFFFKDNPVQNNLINALSAILHQLLNLYPDTGQLWGLIEATCHNLPKRTVFCIFGAFDEESRIRFLVTSQGYSAIVGSFQSIAENLVRLEGEEKSEKDRLQNEIDIVFRHRVESLIKDRRLGQRVSELRYERLHTKGRGQRTYLWVRLVFKFLDNNCPLNLDGWRDLLDQLPEDVPGVYEKLLSNVSSTDRRHVETLLRLVYVAEEPLSLSAANIAVNLCGKYSLDSLDELGLSDEQSFKEWVINTCGFFIRARYEYRREG